MPSIHTALRAPTRHSACLNRLTPIAGAFLNGGNGRASTTPTRLVDAYQSPVFLSHDTGLYGNPQSLFPGSPPLTSSAIPSQTPLFCRRRPTPPLNGTTSRARFCQCQNQRRAFHATRKERTSRADHPYAASVEVEVGRGKTVAESVKKIGVTEQTYYRWKKQYGGLRIDFGQAAEGSREGE